MNNFTFKVLELFAKYDIRDSLFWTIDHEKIVFTVSSSDLLAWGGIDAEYVTEENFNLLLASIADCQEIDKMMGAYYGCDLFICRSYKMRPQGCRYPKNRELWSLFDSCGPEREVGIGNPYKPGKT